MRKLLLVTLVALTACSSHSGNYTKVSDAYNVQMADDSASRLAAIYPPASTRLTLSQKTGDAYGTELVKKLHEKGYALEESNVWFSNTPKNTDTSTKPPVSSTKLSYVVDPVGEQLYRVKLTIGPAVLSRVYSITNNIIAPAGSWTRKE